MIQTISHCQEYHLLTLLNALVDKIQGNQLIQAIALGFLGLATAWYGVQTRAESVQGGSLTQVMICNTENSTNSRCSKFEPLFKPTD